MPRVTRPLETLRSAERRLLDLARRTHRLRSSQIEALRPHAVEQLERRPGWLSLSFAACSPTMPAMTGGHRGRAGTLRLPSDRARARRRGSNRRHVRQRGSGTRGPPRRDRTALRATRARPASRRQTVERVDGEVDAPPSCPRASCARGRGGSAAASLSARPPRILRRRRAAGRRQPVRVGGLRGSPRRPTDQLGWKRIGSIDQILSTTPRSTPRRRTAASTPSRRRA